MKTVLFALLPLLLTGWDASRQPASAAAKNDSYNITERGRHHRLWERVETEPTPDGRDIQRSRRYAEMETGMNYWENGSSDDVWGKRSSSGPVRTNARLQGYELRWVALTSKGVENSKHEHSTGFPCTALGFQ